MQENTPKKIAFLYSTVDGHTRKICQRLMDIVEADGFRSSLIELNSESSADIGEYDQIVIGASIRYGKHRPEVQRFMEKNRADLEAKSGAFFSVNAVARKPEKRTPDTNPYVRKLFEDVAWKPAAIGVFAGRIHYAKYGFIDRTMIRFIMWITKGPTDLDTDADFTDWSDVEKFGRMLCKLGREGDT